MKPGDSIRRALIVQDILRTGSDVNHILSMNEILDELDFRNITADRRTVYDAIHALQENGCDIRYVRSPKQGYYMEHTFTPAEALVLSDAVRTSPSLSAKNTEILLNKLLAGLSDSQKEELQNTRSSTKKTDNESVLTTIGIIQHAIAEHRTIRFRYYDFTPAKKKQYRRSGEVYTVEPYAIVSGNGRFYCAAFTGTHSTFAPYRIDKMDNVRMTEESYDPRPFDTDAWLRSSFNMYTGDPQTITCMFGNELASAVFDRFGTDIIISSIGEDRFRASIRTALTPTLVSWILQFQNRIEVLQPSELREQLKQTGEHLIRIYGKETYEHERKD